MRTPLLTALLSAIFFASGAGALVFETLWFRLARLAFGNSVWASSLVLSSFMAGLALGNAATLRLGARLRRPIHLYVWLEVSIAVSGVALVYGLPALSGWLAPRLAGLADAPWLLNPLRLSIAFACLVVPATAMGATLPVLVRALHLRDPRFGAVLGRLYAFNTLGAVLGALAPEAALIAWFGVRGSAWCAVVLYAAAALAALAVARRLEAQPAQTSIARVETRGRLRAWSLAAAAFLTGGILLAFEVVWFRFLSLFVNPTSLSFAAMLAVVLAGIALGAGAAAWWLGRDPTADRHAPALAFLAGALAVALYAAFPVAYRAYGTDVVDSLRDVVWLSACVALPVAFASGALFTHMGAALHREIGPEIRAAGALTLANTIGGGLGALCGGFLLLPALGMERSIFLLSALYAVAGVLLLAVRSRAGAEAGWRAPLAAGALLALGLVGFPFGSLRSEHLAVPLRRLGGPETRIADVREGRTETVIYLRTDLRGEPLYHQLLTGAFGMASDTTLSQRYMKLFVYWPIAFLPDCRSALLVSYGIGNTAKALVDTRSLQRIDVVDLSRDVLAASDVVFPNPEDHPLRDPRVRVHVEDGRYFLQSTSERYDLITSEPPPPKHAGVDGLYTREYFQLIRDRLSDGGIASYWVPVNTLRSSDTLAIVRAWCDVFPDCSLWIGVGASWMLIGSRDAQWSRSEADFRRQWDDPDVGPELRELGIELPEQLGALFLDDAEGLRERTRDVLPLVDDFPKRLRAGDPEPADWEAHWAWMESGAARDRFERSRFVESAWPTELRERTLRYFAYQGMINDLAKARWRRVDMRERFERLHRVVRETPLETLPLWLLDVQGHTLRAVERLLERGDPEELHLHVLASRAFARRDFEAAARGFAGLGRQLAATGRERASRLALYREALAYCLAGQPEQARARARAAGRWPPREAADHVYWAWLSPRCGAAFDEFADDRDPVGG